MSNPAQDGIDAAREDAARELFMEKLCEEFKAFVIDAMRDGTVVNLDDVNNFDDHMRLLEAAMKTFIAIKEEE